MQNTIIINQNARLLNAATTAVTTATPLNIVSIVLNPGDYAITGAINFTPAGTTSVTVLSGGINSVTATLPSIDNGLVQFSTAANVIVNPFTIVIPELIITIAGNTSATLYLVANAVFTVSTLTASGYINAKQLRR